MECQVQYVPTLQNLLPQVPSLNTSIVPLITAPE